MSWSISFIGKAEKVVEALEQHSNKLDSVSKIEYDNALPNMVSLVKQNFGFDAELVKVTASGHGYFENGVAKTSRCNVEVTTIYGLLV